MIIEKSLLEVSEILKKGEISSKELTLECINRAKETSKYNALHEICENSAIKQAENIDKRRKAGESLQVLAGIPIVLKDIISYTESYTTCSSKFLKDYRSPYDATVTKKLLENGAVILGKANMDEFAMGSSTETCAFGVVHNPRNFDYVPGGSSGGSATTVALNQCFGALGTDTGGSIRQPSSFCGVVGLKPTYGTVSRYGVIAFASSLDQVGPITKTVKDNAIMLDAILGEDKNEFTSTSNTLDLKNCFKDSIKGLKIGIAKEFFEMGMDPEIQKSLDEVISFFKENGAIIIDVSLPNIKQALAVYYVLSSAECASNLARFDGIKYGTAPEKYEDLIDFYYKARTEGFGSEVKRRIMLGNFVLSSGYFDAYYNKAKRVQNLIIDEFNKAYEKCDVIISPTAPTSAFKIGEKINDPLQMYLNDIYTVPVNIARLPGLSVPFGLSKGMPIGLQLIGQKMSEGTLYNIGDFMERHFNKGGIR